MRHLESAAPPVLAGSSGRRQTNPGSQPSDAPTAGMVAAAISGAVQQFGIGGCAGRMAQEFGDHPEAAVTRMRWVRQLIGQRPAAKWQQVAA